MGDFRGSSRFGLGLSLVKAAGQSQRRCLRRTSTNLRSPVEPPSRSRCGWRQRCRTRRRCRRGECRRGQCGRWPMWEWPETFSIFSPPPRPPRPPTQLATPWHRCFPQKDAVSRAQDQMIPQLCSEILKVQMRASQPRRARKARILEQVGNHEWWRTLVLSIRKDCLMVSPLRISYECLIVPKNICKLNSRLRKWAIMKKTKVASDGSFRPVFEFLKYNCTWFENEEENDQFYQVCQFCVHVLTLITWVRAFIRVVCFPLFFWEPQIGASRLGGLRAAIVTN